MKFAIESPNDGASNVWLTPRDILSALGPFDLDPASCPGWETARKHYYEADNGLLLDWDGVVWLNPPFGRHTHLWVDRWVKHRNGFLLVAARPDTSWFHAAAKSADLAWFPRGRIKFLPGPGTKWNRGPAFPTVIFAAGDQASERLRHLPGLHWDLSRQCASADSAAGRKDG